MSTPLVRHCVACGPVVPTLNVTGNPIITFVEPGELVIEQERAFGGKAGPETCTTWTAGTPMPSFHCTGGAASVQSMRLTQVTVIVPSPAGETPSNCT